MKENPKINCLAENFEDFFENSLCGYVNANADGQIIRANKRIGEWLGTDSTNLNGKTFSELLTVGGRIYYETHLWPLLRMQGFFDEVAVELLCSNGEKQQVLCNAYEVIGTSGSPQLVRFTLFKARDRRLYEENLRMAKKLAEAELENERNNALLREQFIAVLGHDLRNPLASIIGANSILARSASNALDIKMIAMMQKSTTRMLELIDSIMDFARTRLGEGLILNFKETEVASVLQQVIDELSVAWPHRVIEYNFEIIELLYCDSFRLSQLFSNLLANAITHGSPSKPVYVRAALKNKFFELAVINSGKAIPATAMEKLFKPFTRAETHPSKNGLGLGLYIASEIAKAHKGELTVTSDENSTCFKFTMKSVGAPLT